VTSSKTGSDVKENLETQTAKICRVYKIAGEKNRVFEGGIKTNPWVRIGKRRLINIEESAVQVKGL
jgi:hypothetical protein